MFYIILFIEVNRVEGVPHSWVSDGCAIRLCAWPPKDARNCIKDQTEPEESWKSYKCRILGTADTYNKMLEKTHKAKSKSNIDTTDCEDISTSKRALFSKNSSDSSDAITPPAKKKSALVA